MCVDMWLYEYTLNRGNSIIISKLSIHFISTGIIKLLIKRLIPLQTHLDYADSRLKSSADAHNKNRVLDKRKTQDAIQATYVTADDFNSIFEHRQDVAVLHDLRFSVPEGKLHIDHLFITDNFHVFIVESRTAATKITLNSDRHFTSTDDQAEACAIPSPIHQLKLNKAILKRVLRGMDLPTRLGRTLTPIFHNFVLIDSQAILSNKLGTGYEYFLSPEQLITLIDRQAQKKSFLHFFDKMSTGALRGIARQIAQLHVSKEIRFSNKFRHIVIPSFDSTVH